jgi:hypothetical protein
MNISVALALCTLAGTVLADETLLRVRIDTPGARKIAEQFEHGGFDVIEGSVSDKSLEIVASERSYVALSRMGLSMTTIEKGRPYEQVQAEQQADGGVPTGYPNLAAINAQMNNRASLFPNLCKVVNLTSTYGTPLTANGRSIFGVKISDNVNADEDEPSFLLVGCHHAREIGTPTVALDTLDRLLNGYGVNQNITDLVNKYEIWIVPVWNPDGYEYVFTTNNLWRKNRRNNGSSFGVDLNRNYAFGWSSACAGSTTASSDTYKGPSAGSEPETQLMTAFSNAKRFTKVIDYHSFGREVLYAYACLNHPLQTWIGQEAAAISSASGYSGATRSPSANGEHPDDQLAYRGAYAFLTEIGTAFQPTYTSAQNEAAQLWNGNLHILNRAIPVSGHVTRAGTSLPVQATITVTGLTFSNGETNGSGGPFGRYHAFLPAGNYVLNFSAPGYLPASRVAAVTASTELTLDVALVPTCSANCDGSTAVPYLNVSDFACFLNLFASGDTAANCDGSTATPILNVQDFACFLNKFAAGCSAP